MAVLTLAAGDLARLLSSSDVATALDGIDVVLVDTTEGAVEAGWRPGSLPVVIVGVGDGGGDPEPFDVVVPADDPLLDAIVDRTAAHPIAAGALAVLLRDSERRSVEAGLAAESAVYSTLQSGADFAQWRRSRPARAPVIEAGPAVDVRRIGDQLHVLLDRPRRHNALNKAMRDGLAAAFAVALDDTTITTVILSGAGPSFCSGGDLDEFGTFPDPATAHVTRLARSPARLAHRLHQRLQVHLHGSCLGAGIELPAFAGAVSAREDTVIGLPEIDLGLIPGAGGTVSLPRRIGRHRTAALALSGMRLDARTALRWGLVDRIEPPPAPGPVTPPS